ncbi:MAG: glycoside hydrolase family 38 C-terminal domain-containing protein [Bacteroidales bacterium]|nr:glycoside hydrolase family 38 C-terminal domain-containing protein [Bacteroidales bacterium]
MKLKAFLLAALCSASAVALAQPAQKKAYVVSNAHFDTQWNWDVQTSIKDYIPKTLNTNLFLLNKYPNYVFNFEGGIKYAWMKEYYPDTYERIKPYVKSGRWHISGASWDATDTNLPNPEAFIRNIMLGQHFYMKEFGVLSTDIFLPDCFGFGYTLPTVAKHCGLIGFSTQKLQWRYRPFYDGKRKTPFDFGLWEGVDGSRIMMAPNALDYTSRWSTAKRMLKELDLYASNNPFGTVYRYYGTGDTGGSPTIGSVRSLEEALKDGGDLQVISATSDQLFKDYLPFEAHPELPVYKGELLMDVHGTGCYTSQAAMKLFNRRNELVALAAERAASVAHWMGAVPYPSTTLDEAWKRFVWHQFHDDLTGTSIPRAYEFSWNDEIISLKQFANVLTTSVDAVSRRLNTQVSGTPVVLYNPSSAMASEAVEAEIATAKAVKGVTVTNEQGKRVKAQVVSSEAGKTRIVIDATVPALGYAVYDVRTTAGTFATATSQANAIENSVYSLRLDANGDICSLIDKRCGKQLVAEGKALRLALFTSNMSTNWPAWEIRKKEIDKEPQSITGAEIALVENGAMRKALKVTRKFGNSAITQYIRLYEGAQADRIDISCDVDWQEKNALLKAEFPLSVSNPNATYDLGIGAVERGNNTDLAYEVFAHQWTDLTNADGSYGVAVLNDCKYGCDKPADNTIRLTLLHTPGVKGNYQYQGVQDHGRHHFTYSIVGHSGSYQDAGVVAKAEALNQGIKAFVAPKHKGDLGKAYSFASSSNPNVVLKALKKAEDCADEYVVRFFETSGKGEQRADFTFCAPIAEAQEINGIEQPVGAATASGNVLSVKVPAFGIKSYKVKLAKAQGNSAMLAQQPIALPLNHTACNYNAFHTSSNFDGRGHAYAAEIWPEEVNYGGVNFRLGSADGLNALRCDSQKVELPAGFNRIYLLAAAIGNDVKTTLKFNGEKIKTTEVEIIVPSYTGFVGQWGHYGQSESYMKPAEVAFVGTHRHHMTKGDKPYEFTYMHMIPVDVPAGATSLTLPVDVQPRIFAATAVADPQGMLKPATDIMRAGLPLREMDNSGQKANLLEGKPCIERTGEVNQNERAECAVDGDVDTKWCDAGEAPHKYIAFDLGKVTTISEWKVLHATLESLAYTTKEYCLQVKENIDDEWTTVDQVSENSEIETLRALPTEVKARYVRLYVSKATQFDAPVTRIYEFAVY